MDQNILQAAVAAQFRDNIQAIVANRGQADAYDFVDVFLSTVQLDLSAIFVCNSQDGDVRNFAPSDLTSFISLISSAVVCMLALLQSLTATMEPR